jgi:hypothetical protein
LGPSISGLRVRLDLLEQRGMNANNAVTPLTLPHVFERTPILKAGVIAIFFDDASNFVFAEAPAFCNPRDRIKEGNGFSGFNGFNVGESRERRLQAGLVPVVLLVLLNCVLNWWD